MNVRRVCTCTSRGKSLRTFNHNLPSQHAAPVRPAADVVARSSIAGLDVLGGANVDYEVGAVAGYGSTQSLSVSWLVSFDWQSDTSDNGRSLLGVRIDDKLAVH